MIAQRGEPIMAVSTGWRAVLGRVRVLMNLERRLFRLLLVYALTIAVSSLIIPLTVQELVNTFAYAIQPIMIITLAGIMVLVLLLVGGYRALQYYAVEILERRVFARVALALTNFLPGATLEGFKPKYVNQFMETIFLQRALSVLLVDILNVVIGGVVGMTILVFYHPYFIGFDAALIAGFLAVVVLFSHGGLQATLAMSHAKYDTLGWLQEIAANLLHAKASISRPWLAVKTDALIRSYTKAREARFRVLIRQYLSSVGWQACVHSGLIAMAGWLLAEGQITLGQFVAAEVIVGSLLLNFDSVVKRMPHLFYLLTALTELDELLSRPRDRQPLQACQPLPDPMIHGLRLTCTGLSYAYPGAHPVFEAFDLDVTPGEAVSVLAETSSGQTALARVLAGLFVPTSGVIRYNGVDLRELDIEELQSHLGVVFDSQLSLFDGTLEDNIMMGRPAVRYQDVRWALSMVELEDEMDAMPEGLRTPVSFRGPAFTTSLVQRILVARAVATHPSILILEGSLQGIPTALRERILRRLCSKEEPWSVICVSTDPTFTLPAARHLTLA
jgi:putative ABC transport system ATP-binding protein